MLSSYIEIHVGNRVVIEIGSYRCRCRGDNNIVFDNNVILWIIFVTNVFEDQTKSAQNIVSAFDIK